MLSRTATIMRNALNIVPLDDRNNVGPIKGIKKSKKSYHNLEPLQPSLQSYPVGVNNITIEQDIEQRCAKDMDTNVPHNSLNIEPLTGFDGVEADHSYFIIDHDIGQKMCTEEIDNSLQPFCPYKIDVPLSTLDNTETGAQDMIPSCSYVSIPKNVGGDNIQQRSQMKNVRNTEIRTYSEDFDASSKSSSDYQPESEPSDVSSDDNIPLDELRRRIKKKQCTQPGLPLCDDEKPKEKLNEENYKLSQKPNRKNNKTKHFPEKEWISRKRTRNPDTWKRCSAALAREKGLDYISQKGKHISGKHPNGQLSKEKIENLKEQLPFIKEQYRYFYENVIEKEYIMPQQENRKKKK